MLKKLVLLGMVILAATLALTLVPSNTSSANEGIQALVDADISYDGFCDGVHISADPVTGIASGQQIGCTTGDMIGTVGVVRAHGQGPGVVMSYAGDADYVGFHTVIVLVPRVWFHYQSDGAGSTVLVNSGTWSRGTPTLTNNNAASVSQ